MFQQTLKVLQQFQTEKGVTLQTTDTGIIEKRPGNNEVTVTTKIGEISGTFPSSVSQEKIRQIIKMLSDNGIQANFETALELGKVFKDYGLIDNVLDQGQTRLTHQNNQVLLLNIWATWCPPCQKPMQKNQQMLQKNEENWKGKVRFVSVGVDDLKQTVRERVTSKGWLKSVQLTFLGWRDDHPLIQDYQVTGIPFFCLVNKWGKVDFLGHPNQIDLQNRINELLLQTSDPSLNPSAPIVSNTKKNPSQQYAEHLMKTLSSQEIQKHFQNVELIVIRYGHKTILKKGVYKHHLQIYAYIIDGDQIAQKTVQKLFQKNENLQLTLNKVKYYTIPKIQNPQCFICRQKHLQYPYYWLKWEQQNTFGCKRCVQMKPVIPGHHYQYEKNSILLCGPWSKVAQKDVGNNIQPTSPQDVQDDHQYQCNGCGGGSNGIGCARYISLGSRADPNFQSNGHVDFCESCMQKFIQKDQKIIDALASQRYSPNHPFLRVLYNVKGYYDY